MEPEHPEHSLKVTDKSPENHADRQRRRNRERRRLINAALTAALIILKVTAFIILPTVLTDEDENINEE